MTKLLKKLPKPTLSLLLLLTVWQLSAEGVLFFRGVSFPTPGETFLRLLELLSGKGLAGHSLYVHLFSSLRRWATGFAVAALSGVSYGLAAGRIRALELATSEIPQLLLLVPGLAWVPVAILLFGIGETATLFMIAVSAFAPIAVSVFSGARNIDVRLLRAAEMMGAGEGAIFLRVFLPATLPSILSGLRVGLGTSWRVLVAAEMVVGSGTGLGYSLIQARWTLDYASSFACIAVICGIGFFFERILLRRLEKRTIDHWAPVAEKG